MARAIGTTGPSPAAKPAPKSAVVSALAGYVQPASLAQRIVAPAQRKAYTQVFRQPPPPAPKPAAPARKGPTLSGKISWFGGPHDSTTSQVTASGLPVTVPGIAVYNQKTLGGYWLVHMPNGNQAILRQTDIGPAPWTGRSMDFLYSALPHLGYTEQNFPTNAHVSAAYLGRSAVTAHAAAPHAQFLA